jgi:radical SAM protein with 4Fe4S-binding SPASM domain
MIDEFVDAGVVDMAVSGGEPLVRRDLCDVISHATSRGLCVGVGSNGGRLTPAQARRLKQTGINRFQLSLDGFAKAHDTLRCWPGLFTRVLRSIQTASDSGLRVHVCLTINRLNALQLNEFAHFLCTLPVSRLNLSRYVPTGRGRDDLDLTKEEWHATIIDCLRLRRELQGRLEITTHLAQHALIDDSVVSNPTFVGCQAGRGQGCVAANGDVFPCVLLPVPLGNLREARFIDIWRDSLINQRLNSRGDLKGECGTCSVREQCGGCRAVAYAQTGDWLASDPRCWLVHQYSHARRFEMKVVAYGN